MKCSCPVDLPSNYIQTTILSGYIVSDSSTYEAIELYIFQGICDTFSFLIDCPAMEFFRGFARQQ